MQTINFAKGHGTCNDFVILVDRENLLDLSDEQVQWLCDRRAGIGGDGLLRAVKLEPNAEEGRDRSLWFMDYRNADGSIAEMCGNGLRVFVQHLLQSDLVDTSPIKVLTRAGLRDARRERNGWITVGMGPAIVAQQRTWIEHQARRYPAVTVDVGNPHAVVILDNTDDLAGLDLTTQPGFDPAVYPSGVNVEFVVATAPHELRMRVHERGVGETQSCGTGVVAAVAAHSALTGELPTVTSVHVPGGELHVSIGEDQAHLSGPAVIVAHGTVSLPG